MPRQNFDEVARLIVRVFVLCFWHRQIFVVVVASNILLIILPDFAVDNHNPKSKHPLINIKPKPKTQTKPTKTKTNIKPILSNKLIMDLNNCYIDLNYIYS